MASGASDIRSIPQEVVATSGAAAASDDDVDYANGDSNRSSSRNNDNHSNVNGMATSEEEIYFHGDGSIGAVSGRASECSEGPKQSRSLDKLSSSEDVTSDDEEEELSWRALGGQDVDSEAALRRHESEDGNVKPPSSKDHVAAASAGNDGDDENLKYNRIFPRPLQRCWSGCWDSYPRCCALIIRITFPMIILMTCAVLGGWLLAGFEAPAEYYSNDVIIAARKYLGQMDLNRTTDVLNGLPVTCLNEALENYVVSEARNKAMVDSDTNTTVELDDLDENFSLPRFVEDLREDMAVCSKSKSPELVEELIVELNRDAILEVAFSEPTFTWIR